MLVPILTPFPLLLEKRMFAWHDYAKATARFQDAA